MSVRPIMDEYIAVLSRMGFKEEAELDELLRFFARGFHTLYTTNTPKLDIVEKDPDDNKFIECAVALKAEYIISGDKALQEIKEYIGIKILNPKQFLDYYSVL